MFPGLLKKKAKSTNDSTADKSVDESMAVDDSDDSDDSDTSEVDKQDHQNHDESVAQQEQQDLNESVGGTQPKNDNSDETVDHEDDESENELMIDESEMASDMSALEISTSVVDQENLTNKTMDEESDEVHEENPSVEKDPLAEEDQSIQDHEESTSDEESENSVDENGKRQRSDAKRSERDSESTPRKRFRSSTDVDMLSEKGDETQFQSASQNQEKSQSSVNATVVLTPLPTGKASNSMQDGIEAMKREIGKLEQAMLQSSGTMKKLKEEKIRAKEKFEEYNQMIWDLKIKVAIAETEERLAE